MIKIGSNITIPTINNLYIQLQELQKKEKVDLTLPSQITKSDFGGLFSLIQFIGTWMRLENSGKLILPIIGLDNAKAYLFDNDFVYPAIALAWENEIVDTEGNNLKLALKEPSKEYFTKMDFFQLKNRSSIPIFCFDHDKSNRGFSRHFYDNSKELLPEGSVGFNLYPAFLKIGSITRTFSTSISSSLSSFESIIHELFSNTHDHAKTNELGYNLYPNIRAVNLTFHKKPLEKYIELYKEFPGLIEYLESDFKLNEQGELYLIEISVLDSGPGLVKRYKGISEYNLSINEEVEIIKECLHRHNTSTVGSREDVKGLGLDRVLQTIDGKGFVRIKSGRADVFRNMKKWRYHHHEKASDIALYDWQKNSSSQFNTYPETQGTLVSIFFPLDYSVFVK